MRILWIFGGLVVALGLIAGATLWSWTRTPFGPMDPGAALIEHGMRMATGGGDGGTLADLPAEVMAERRAIANRATAWMLPLEPLPVARIFDDTIPAAARRMPVRVYVPEGEGPFPIVYYMHGGAFWTGDALELWDGRLTRIAARVPALVVSIDYRLAPEHPFPAAVEDSWEGLLWVAAHGADWNGDASRLAVMGGSAGGNLAAVLAHRVRDEGGPPLVSQVLFVPAVRLGGHFNSEMRELIEYFSGKPYEGPRERDSSGYLQHPAQADHPWASPLLSERFDGLPPALILSSQFDTLRGHGEAYAEKLRAAGVPATFRSWDGAVHGYLGSPAKLEAAVGMVTEELRRAFAR
jgi:acetyl esterase